MLNFALIGCGRITRKHAGLLGEGHIDGAKLTAVCDIKKDRAETYGKKYNVPWYTDMHQMMQELDDKIDVVCILTESGNHSQHTVEIAPYKKHIVVEKPMALTLEGADAMIRACDEAGVKLFVVKQNRYNLPVQKAREALDQGRFGNYFTYFFGIPY